MDKSKPFWKSYTFLFNALSLLALILTDTANSELLKAWPHLTEQIIGAVTIINIILRFKTNVGITLTSILAGAMLLTAPREASAQVYDPLLTLNAPSAQVQPALGLGGSFYYDIRDHETYAVATKLLTEIADIKLFGMPKFSLDLGVFAGGALKDGAFVGGFYLGKNWDVAKNASLFLGAGGALRQGDKVFSSTGPMVGYSVRF